MITEFKDKLPGLQSASSMRDIVLHLIECVQQSRTESFDAFFSFLEEQIIYSEPEIRQMLIIELLEDLKNQSSICDLDYVIFENWLGPETHIAWRWLEKKWQGKKSLADRAKI
jgi:hypothetical protein